jgi:hypothetical protein
MRKTVEEDAYVRNTKQDHSEPKPRRVVRASSSQIALDLGEELEQN